MIDLTGGHKATIDQYREAILGTEWRNNPVTAALFRNGPDEGCRAIEKTPLHNNMTIGIIRRVDVGPS